VRNRVLAAALVLLVLASSVLAPVVTAGAVAQESGGEVSGEIDVIMDAATNGSTATYELANSSKASEFNVSVTGSKSTEAESVSATRLTSGETLDVPVAGTTSPEDEIVTFTGREQSRTVSWSGTNVQSGDSRSVNVLGNLPPENRTVTFTGHSSGEWINKTTADVTQSTNVSLDGLASTKSQAPDPVVNLTGVTSTEWDNESASGLDPNGAQSVNIGGNIAPTGPGGGDALLTVTATQNTATQYESWSGSSRLAGEGNPGLIDSEIAVDNPPDIVSALSMPDLSVTNSVTVTVDVYIVEETPDNTYGEGTQVASSVDLTSGGELIDIQDYATSSDVVTVEFITQSSGGSQNKVKIGFDESASGNYWNYILGGDTSNTYGPDNAYPNIRLLGKAPGDVDVSADGSTYDVGTFTSSGSESIRLPVSTSATQLDFSATGGGSLNTTLELRERTQTTDPSIELNGNTKTISGTFGDGETRSVAFDNSVLQNGSNSVSVSLPSVTSDAPDMKAEKYGVSIRDVNATEDPSIDVGSDGSINAQYDGVLLDGETAEVPLSGLDTGSQSLTFGSDHEPFDWTLSATERAQTEDPGVDLDGDGTIDVEYSGTLSEGETVAREADLSLGSNPSEVSTRSWAGSGVKIDYTEVTESKNPSVIINGHEASYDGTLADGETASLNASTEWLQNGSNTVEVRVGEQLSAGSPRARVGVQYQHVATTTHETSYNATAWQESRSINKTFVDDRANAELELYFQPSVVTISQLQMGMNGATLERVDPSQYEYDDGVVTLQLGTVEENDSVSVRAVGRRMRVHDGRISIEEPTLPGKSLDTKFEITQKGENFAMEFNTQQVVHTTDESWSNPSESSRITEDGTQMFRLPGASEGSTARAEYTPLRVIPDAGDAEVSIEDLSNRQFSVEPGKTSGDTIEYRWQDVIEGADYALYSLTHRNTYDTASAMDRGVTITDDDSEETLQFTSQNEDGPGPISDSETIRSGLVLLLVGGTLVGLYVLQERYGSGVSGPRDYVVLVLVAAVVGALGLEMMSPGTISQTISGGAFPMLLASIVGVGVLYWTSHLLPGGSRAKLAYFAAGFTVVGLTLLETLSPGSVSNTLGPTISSAVEPAIRIGGIGLVGLAIYQVYRWVRSNDSSSSNDSGGSGGSGSDSSASNVNVIVSDDDEVK